MRIVFKRKTKTGKEIIIRYPNVSDLDEMLKYINELSDEKTFVRYQGEHETLESETKYLKSILKAITNKKSVHLLAFFNNKLIAVAEVCMKDKTEHHVGILGISVAKNFRKKGVGKLLMKLILKEAEKVIPNLRIVTLDVYSTNSIAQRMYKEFGFAKYGKLLKGISRGGKFEDAVLMYKNII